MASTIPGCNYDDGDVVTRMAGGNENNPNERTIKNQDLLPTGKGFNRKKAVLMKEQARALVDKDKYYEATVLLEEVHDFEEITNLGTRLLLAECQLQLGREIKAERSIKYIEKELSSPPLPDPQSILSLASELFDNSRHVRGLLLLKIAANAFLTSQVTPNERLTGSFRCYSKLDDVVTKMLQAGGRLRTLAADIGMDAMLDLLQSISTIPDCSIDDRVVKSAWCCRYLDFNYSLLGENKKSVQIAQKAVKSMEEHFGVSGASRHRVFGALLHNIGVTLCNTDRMKEAEEITLRALEAKELAQDYDNEVQRQKEIEVSKNGLKLIRRKI